MIDWRRWSIRALAGLTLTGLAATGGTVGFWVADRAIPTQTIRAELLTPEVAQGGELQTRRIVFRERLCHTAIDRYFIDSTGRRFDMGVTTYPNGTGNLGQEDFIGVQSVPEAMAVGAATFTALACYHCNPIHWLWPLCESPRTRQFMVTAKK